MLRKNINRPPVRRHFASFLQSFIAIGDNKKKDLLHIQWFVAIAGSYLLLFKEGQLVQEPINLFLLILPLGSILIFLRVPDSVFACKFFPQAVALTDTLVICTAIAFNKQSPWDLFLVFFFGILIAAIGENFLQIVIGCLVLSFISIVLVPVSDDLYFQVDSEALLRIPLLFGASLVYGYLADQVKREKKHAAQLDEARKQQLLIKDQFVSHVSHELRTPLTAIHQFVTILTDGLAGDLNEEQRDYLGIVLRNVKQLQTMVGDLLEAARADSGKLAIDPQGIALQALVSETVGVLFSAASLKNIVLSADIPSDLPLVYADPQRLNQIFSNLLDNGIKFTRAGSVTVRARVFEADPNFVCVSVADTGSGISPEGTQKIFDRLYQEERSLETNRKGLGLGLHICKEIVSRHGGRIWVESEHGKGSTFYFTLPFFSIKSLLRPIIGEKHPHGDFISLVFVELLPDDVGSISEMTWRGAWTNLNKFAFPDRTVLLPRVAAGGEKKVFFVFHAGNVASANQLASQIQKEIGDCREVKEANGRVETSTMVIDLPQWPENGDVGEFVDKVSAKILESIRDAGMEKTGSQTAKISLRRAASQGSETPFVAAPNNAERFRDKLSLANGERIR